MRKPGVVFGMKWKRNSTQAKNKKNIYIFITNIVLILNYWILFFGPDITVSIFEHIDLKLSEVLHIVRIANIAKPLRILYQISKFFLNLAHTTLSVTTPSASNTQI